jgi:hypothetical protein
MPTESEGGLQQSQTHKGRELNAPYTPFFWPLDSANGNPSSGRTDSHEGEQT